MNHSCAVLRTGCPYVPGTYRCCKLAQFLKLQHHAGFDIRQILKLLPNILVQMAKPRNSKVDDALSGATEKVLKQITDLYEVGLSSGQGGSLGLKVGH